MRRTANVGGATAQYGEFLRCGARRVKAMLLLPEAEGANGALARRRQERTRLSRLVWRESPIILGSRRTERLEHGNGVVSGHSSSC
jgi:hypothetical protein